MNKFFVANWKLNPQTEKEAIFLAKAEDFQNVVIAPPFPFLKSVSTNLKKSKIAAQNIFWEKSGAYTGEVSPAMLGSLNVEYVIIGHSERRKIFNETDEIINKKIQTALEMGLKIILCVGENWVVRKKGLSKTRNFIKNQLKKDLKISKNLKLAFNNLIIAYEPVWAIGTGKSDNPKETAEIIGFIKKFLIEYYKLKARVLYGGSVNSKNAKYFLEKKEIDGVLVGGASLKPEEFKKIVKVF